MRDDLIDPVRAFMSGSQKDIYREARAFLREQKANFSCVTGEEAARMTAILDAPDCFRGNRMQQVRALQEALRTQIEQQREQDRDAAKKRSEELHQKLLGMAEFALLGKDAQQKLTDTFLAFAEKVEAETLIPVIRDSLRHFEDHEYPLIIAELYTCHPLPLPLSR